MEEIIREGRSISLKVLKSLEMRILRCPHFFTVSYMLLHSPQTGGKFLYSYRDDVGVKILFDPNIDLYIYG